MNTDTRPLIALSLLCCLQYASAQITFTPAAYYSVKGPLVDSIVAGDFNGDRKVDLISLDVNANTLSFVTNNGSGIFGSNATLNVGPSPTAICTQDINGDGKLDVVSANYGNNTLTVLTNNGSGMFGFDATLTVGSEPRRVAAADLNGDGRMDLVSANSGNNTLTVLTNSGGGNFGFNATYSVGGFPTSVTAADINGDGKLDLISANYYTNKLTVLTNNGFGVFGNFATLTVDNGPYAVVATDLNGDGKMDLVTANLGNTSYSYTLSVLLNNGSGVFSGSVNYTVGNSPNSVAVADFNGDRKPDLVCANQNPTQVNGQWVYSLTLLTNNGSGGFAVSLTIPTDSQDIDPYSATAADVDGDGKMDLIYADQQHAKIVVLINTTTYPTPPNLGIGTYSNLPAVFFPTVPGTNFVLQMTTNLSTGDWVTVTNGIPISGVIVTNPPSNAFFRLR